MPVTRRCCITAEPAPPSTSSRRRSIPALPTSIRPTTMGSVGARPCSAVACAPSAIEWSSRRKPARTTHRPRKSHCARGFLPKPFKGLLRPFKLRLDRIRSDAPARRFFAELSAQRRRRQLEAVTRSTTSTCCTYTNRRPKFCAPTSSRSTMETLRREGKVRYVGVSCESVEDTWLSLDLPNVAAVQLTINLLERRGIDLLPRALERGVGVIARNPRAAGLLTQARFRRHRRDLRRRSSRFRSGATRCGVVRVPRHREPHSEPSRHSVRAAAARRRHDDPSRAERGATHGNRPRRSVASPDRRRARTNSACRGQCHRYDSSVRVPLDKRVVKICLICVEVFAWGKFGGLAVRRACSAQSCGGADSTFAPSFRGGPIRSPSSSWTA